MLHRALFGSLERFIGILIENYAGKFPFWISPLQTVVIPISDEFNDYAKKVSDQIKQAGMSSVVDLKNHNLNYKIRDHSLACLLYTSPSPRDKRQSRMPSSA